jgi:hypothetical protein
MSARRERMSTSKKRVDTGGGLKEMDDGFKDKVERSICSS